MNPLKLTSSSSLVSWLIFLAVILTVGLVIGIYILWAMGLREAGKAPHRKHHKRRRRHHRQHNPTLAQSGGLPPKRPDGEPPPGP